MSVGKTYTAAVFGVAAASLEQMQCNVVDQTVFSLRQNQSDCFQPDAKPIRLVLWLN